MGGGPISSVDVHWPHFIDSALSSIATAGLGYGNPVDDYSLAMAAPAALWGNSTTTTRAQITPAAGLGAVVPGNMHTHYGALLNMSTQLAAARPPPQLSAGFGGGAAAAATGMAAALINNSPTHQQQQFYARPSPLGPASAGGALLGNGILVDVAQLASGLEAGMLGGGGGMSPLLVHQHQQPPQQMASGIFGNRLAPGGASFTDMSIALSDFQQQRPMLYDRARLFDAPTTTGFPLQQQQPSSRGSAGDPSIVGGDVLVMGMSRPLPSQPLPSRVSAAAVRAGREGVGADGADLLNMSTSLPLLQPGVAGAQGTGSRFMDMSSQFQLTSIPDLPDLSDLADFPAIPAMGSHQAYSLKQEPAQNLTCRLTGDVPFFDRTGIGSDTIATPPLRFADLNVASVPYDTRFRQVFADHLAPPLPPPLLLARRGELRDVGMPVFPLPQTAGGGLPGGSLILDGARSELINISKMTPQEILDAKALAASKNHSEAERRRRERINTHLGTLRTLLPCSTKTDKASLLWEVIDHVKELKRQAAEIEGPIPSEVDDLTVEEGESCAEQPGKAVFKVTVSCDDRPCLLTDLGATLDRCNLENFHMELATVSGRMNVVMLAYSRDEDVPEPGKHEAFMSSVQEALRSVVDKSGVTDNSSGSSGGGLKRQRTMSNSPP